MNKRDHPKQGRGKGKHWPAPPKHPMVCSECRQFQGHLNTCKKAKKKNK